MTSGAMRDRKLVRIQCGAHRRAIKGMEAAMPEDTKITLTDQEHAVAVAALALKIEMFEFLAEAQAKCGRDLSPVS